MNDPNIQLWCEDEVHFQRHSSLVQMWAFRGQQPRVLSASTREKVGYFGTLNLKTGALLTREAPTFNGDTFGDFLRHLLQCTRGQVYLILDNAPWHRARHLKDFFSQHQDRLVRVFLPSYSPELNPVERVMEDHSLAGYPQPLLPVQGRPQNSLEFPIRSVGTPQPCPPGFMRTYLRRYI